MACNLPFLILLSCLILLKGNYRPSVCVLLMLHKDITEGQPGGEADCDLYRIA